MCCKTGEKVSREVTNTKFIVFSLIRPGLETMIYHTRGEQAYHYTTDVVMPLLHSSPKRGEQAYHYTTDVVMPLLHSSPKCGE
jgi:hypothetical protein